MADADVVQRSGSEEFHEDVDDRPADGEPTLRGILLLAQLGARFGARLAVRSRPAAVVARGVGNLLKLAEIEPDQIALPAGIDDDVSRTVIGVHVHLCAAGRTGDPSLEFAP